MVYDTVDLEVIPFTSVGDFSGYLWSRAGTPARTKTCLFSSISIVNCFALILGNHWSTSKYAHTFTHDVSNHLVSSGTVQAHHPPELSRSLLICLAARLRTSTTWPIVPVPGIEWSRWSKIERPKQYTKMDPKLQGFLELDRNSCFQQGLPRGLHESRNNNRKRSCADSWSTRRTLLRTSN